MEEVKVERAHPQQVLQAVVTGEIDLRVLDDLSSDDLARPGLLEARLGTIESAAFVSTEKSGIVGVLAVRSISERDRRAEVVYGCAFGADRDQMSRSLLTYIDTVMDMFELRTVLVSDADELLVDSAKGALERAIEGGSPVRRVGTRVHSRWPYGLALYQISPQSTDALARDAIPTVFRRPREHDRSDSLGVAPQRLNHPIAETLRTALLPLEEDDLVYLRRMECEGSYLDRVRFSGRCPSPDSYRQGLEAAEVAAVVVDLSTGRRAGVIALYGADYFRGTLRFGAIFSPSSEMSGLAIEATAAMVEYAFCAFPIQWLEIEANEYTMGSFSSAEAFGLTKGVQTQGTLWTSGRWVDEFVFSMSRAQFIEMQDRLRLLPDVTSSDPLHARID